MAGSTSTAADEGCAPLTREAALWYARRGLRVHPLQPGSKLPLLEKWQHRATTDAATIGQFWDECPRAGIGIATGARSGVVVLDIDPRHGGDDSLHELEREHGEIPPTWRCLTPGGGLHIYLAHPGGIVRNAVGRWPGIDLPLNVVAPPTALDGVPRAYVWETGFRPNDVPLASVPAWLLGHLRRDRDEGDHQARPADEWATVVRDGAEHGWRNDAVARLAGYLFRCRPSPHVVLELVRSWNQTHCRPPLPDDEVVATIDSIARKEARR